MKIFAVQTCNIEGQSHTLELHSSFDGALEAVKKYITDHFDYPDCWKPYNKFPNWWYYGCDSVGIEEYELQGKLERPND